MIYEESSARLGAPTQIEISQDSKFVALPTAASNYLNTGYSTIGTYGTYVFSVQHLASPVVGIPSGFYPRALGFDRFRDRILTHNFKQSLIVFNPRGVLQREYNFSGRDDPTVRLLPHPRGVGVLVLTKKKLFWVEWG